MEILNELDMLGRTSLGPLAVVIVLLGVVSTTLGKQWWLSPSLVPLANTCAYISGCLFVAAIAYTIFTINASMVTAFALCATGFGLLFIKSVLDRMICNIEEKDNETVQ